MTGKTFADWCDTAVAGIAFPGDRKQVRLELMNHLYDHYDDLVAQGVDRDTARTLALAAMGDAGEIAPQLAAIHRPFWGYLLKATRILLVLTLCAVLWCLWATHTPYANLREDDAFWPYAETFRQDQYSNWNRVFHAEPNQSVECDGYTFTLTQAAVWHETYLGEPREEQDHFYCRIEVFNPRPWATHTNIADWFRAEDSLGNTYDRFYKSIPNNAPFVVSSAYHTGPMTWTHEIYLNCYCSQGAEWIELHYDRSGRDIVFRIDLTGGDAA